MRAGFDAGPCPSWRELVGELLEGAERWSRHRSRCPACRRRWGRLRALASSLSRTGGPGAGGTERCPAPQEWAAFADGAVAETEAGRLRRHLAGCGACGRLWAFLVEVVEEGEEGASRQVSEGGRGEEDAAVPSSRERTAPPPGPRGRLGWLAAAAAASLLLWVVAPPEPIGSPYPERWRGPSSRLMAGVRWPAEGGAPVLWWEPWTGADGYRLRVWSGAGELLLTRDLRETTLRLPPGLGGAAYWAVEALGAGRVLARSDVQELAGGEPDSGPSPSGPVAPR